MSSAFSSILTVASTISMARIRISKADLSAFTGDTREAYQLARPKYAPGPSFVFRRRFSRYSSAPCGRPSRSQAAAELLGVGTVTFRFAHPPALNIGTLFGLRAATAARIAPGSTNATETFTLVLFLQHEQCPSLVDLLRGNVFDDPHTSSVRSAGGHAPPKDALLFVQPAYGYRSSELLRVHGPLFRTPDSLQRILPIAPDILYIPYNPSISGSPLSVSVGRLPFHKATSVGCLMSYAIANCSYTDIPCSSVCNVQRATSRS
jgi:hypothetical protein